jgi:ubiquitin-like-conjugating enzyme ATG10
VLSPTYQVPVLYFQLSSSANEAPAGLKEIYEVLVPSDARGQMEDISVMGAISMAEQPVIGVPMYFVHPCRTADVLRDWEEDVKGDVERYLRIWLGIVGSVVGLYLPIDAMKDQ